MAKENLTARQEKVLEYIKSTLSKRGYPPTMREIGEYMSIRSTNGVSDHLKVLERKGYIRRAGSRSRAITLVEQSSFLPDREILDIPVLGRVAAGLPLLAEENIEDTVRIDRFFIGDGKEVFALRVVGDSMIGDGIFDNDFIFVRKQAQAEPGSIVVVMIEGEVTVKRYYPEGDSIRFQPANDQMKPIIIRKHDFRQTDIIGVVVGVYRKTV
ncbi:MAG: repressor LexA [Deltaproteobacteria bacterium]|nr:repressor LexA [Deltaproteobacteria bacterium]